MTRGSRGASSGRSGGVDAILKRANAPISDNAGASWRGLSANVKAILQEDMKITPEVEDYLRRDLSSIQPEFRIGYPGNEKVKVTTDFSDKGAQYTVKLRNKILLRTAKKEQAANKVAEIMLKQSKALSKK